MSPGDLLSMGRRNGDIIGPTMTTFGRHIPVRVIQTVVPDALVLREMQTKKRKNIVVVPNEACEVRERAAPPLVLTYHAMIGTRLGCSNSGYRTRLGRNLMWRLCFYLSVNCELTRWALSRKRKRVLTISIHRRRFICGKTGKKRKRCVSAK